MVLDLDIVGYLVEISHGLELGKISVVPDK